jgi:hypothetical protein
MRIFVAPTLPLKLLEQFFCILDHWFRVFLDLVVVFFFWVSWRWFFFALKYQPSSLCCWMAWNSSFWRWRSEDFFGTKFHFVKAENICACFAVSAIKCTQLKLLDHQFRCSCVEQQCLPHSWRARYFKSLLKLINHIRRMHTWPPRSLECALC